METNVVDVTERVEALDQLVLEGKILEAVDAFFHPDVFTKEGNGGETQGTCLRARESCEASAASLRCRVLSWGVSASSRGSPGGARSSLANLRGEPRPSSLF